MNLTWDDVDRAARWWSRLIARSEYDYIVGVARGGVIPATILSYRTEIPLLTISVQTRNPDRSQSKPTIAIETGIRQILNEKSVLIVDDIIDSGLTIETIRSIIDKNPKNVNYASLVYNTNLNIDPPEYQYHIIDRSTDQSWVTFPWDNQ